jgi:hypothetical protein
MGFPLPGLLKRAGIAAALLAGAVALLPGHVGAQTPANGTLFPVTAGSHGTGLVSLSGYNTVAVTINGVTSGGIFNVFTCAVSTATPTPSSCQIAGTVTVGSGGQATGTVASPIAIGAIADVFAQNAYNSNELYEAVFNGNYIGTAYGAGGIPGCPAGSVLVWSNGAPTCASNYAGLTGCAQIVYIGNTATCVGAATPGLSYPWWWYYAAGISYVPVGQAFFGICPPGAGFVPVFVNGGFIFTHC